PPSPATTSAACLSSAVLGAAALVWSGIITHAVGHVVTAATMAVTAAVGAVAVRRAQQGIPVLTLSVIAVVFGAAAGFLAVPGDPSTANSMLAASVACSMSLLLLRFTRGGAICLIALATSAGLTAASSACGVAWTLPVTTVGAVLATTSLVL